MADEITVSGQEGADGIESQPAGGSFTPISTQEELDRIVKDRVDRAKRSARKSFETEYAETFRKASEYDKAQEASKTELEKLTERADAAERQLSEYKAREERAGWAAEVAKDKGVPADLLAVCGTREEMEAHADAIAAMLPGTVPQVGGDGSAPNAANSGNDWLRDMIVNR